MWLSALLLILTGLAVAGVAGLFGGAFRAWDTGPVSDAEIQAVEPPVLPVLARRRDESWARRPWPYIRDRLTFPPLDFPAVVIHSSITPGKCYRVDLAVLTCTCNYFLLRGSRAALGSKERLCRHLRRVYAERGGLSAIVNMVLLDDVHFCETDQLWSGEVDGVPVAIAWREGDPWVTLYTRSNAMSQAAEFERYNFHLDRAEWADGRMPRFNAAAIRQMLGDWFGDGKLLG
ncbi:MULTISPECIES: hypothetical protein [Aquitalea]|uniref:hypothetical protein n=1 Tax=Aquitalea TaxID=407217 RepID=UPI0013587298|nr:MULTISPECIES: hypothetical protein [Aquitalea]